MVLNGRSLFNHDDLCAPAVAVPAGAWSCRRRTSRPAHGPIFPLIASHSCACLAVPLLATVVLSDNGCHAFVEEEIQVGVLHAAVIILEPRCGLVGRHIRRGQRGQHLRRHFARRLRNVAQLMSAGPVAVRKFLSMTSLGALPKKMTLPPACAKARRLSRAALEMRVHGRNQNGAISLAALVDQFLARQLEGFRQRVFVHEIQIALMLEQLVDDGQERRYSRRCR